MQLKTRMHSSRMRTARLLPVSPSMYCSGGGVLGLGGVPSRGGVPGGCTWSGGVSGWGVPGPEGRGYLVLGGVPGRGGVYLPRYSPL